MYLVLLCSRAWVFFLNYLCSRSLILVLLLLGPALLSCSAIWHCFTIKKIEHRFDFIRSHLALVLNSTIPIYVYIPRVISLEAKQFLSIFTRWGGSEKKESSLFSKEKGFGTLCANYEPFLCSTMNWLFYWVTGKCGWVNWSFVNSPHTIETSTEFTRDAGSWSSLRAFS